jgi:hypothetical protein
MIHEIPRCRRHHGVVCLHAPCVALEKVPLQVVPILLAVSQVHELRSSYTRALLQSEFPPARARAAGHPHAHRHLGPLYLGFDFTVHEAAPLPSCYAVLQSPIHALRKMIVLA